MPLFSVIVPVYNKAKTLRQCIDSVLMQTISNWELLLINDGSTDESDTIMDSFDDKRIRRINHDNHGVSYSRNRGILNATGEYIVFLDADDFWANSFLEEIATGIAACKADIYFTGITKRFINGSEKKIVFPHLGLIPEDIFRSSFYEIQRKTQLYGYATNKIVRRDFLISNNVFFNEKINMAEDLDFYLRCYALSHSFYFLSCCSYFYVLYPEGTSLYKKDVNYFSLIETQKALKHFCKESFTNEDEEYYAKIIRKLASSAISEISPTKIYLLPSVVKRINNDKEINRYFVEHGNLYILMLKVFFHQLYVRTAQLILRICRK